MVDGSESRGLQRVWIRWSRVLRIWPRGAGARSPGEGGEGNAASVTPEHTHTAVLRGLLGGKTVVEVCVIMFPCRLGLGGDRSYIKRGVLLGTLGRFR